MRCIHVQEELSRPPSLANAAADEHELRGKGQRNIERRHAKAKAGNGEAGRAVWVRGTLGRPSRVGKPECEHKEGNAINTVQSP